MQGLSLSPGDYEREVGKDPTLEARRDAGVRRRAIAARPAPASVTTQQRRLTAPYPCNARAALRGTPTRSPRPPCKPTTPSPARRLTDRGRARQGPTPARPPRTSPASLPHSCALWTTTPERQLAHLPRCPPPANARRRRPRSRSSTLVSRSLGPTLPSESHFSCLPPTFLPVWARPRSRTLMVRGRGRGPNRPPTPVSIGQLHRRPRIRNPGSSPGVNHTRTLDSALPRVVQLACERAIKRGRRRLLSSRSNSRALRFRCSSQAGVRSMRAQTPASVQEQFSSCAGLGASESTQASDAGGQPGAAGNEGRAGSGPERLSSVQIARLVQCSEMFPRGSGRWGEKGRSVPCSADPHRGDSRRRWRAARAGVCAGGTERRDGRAQARPARTGA